MRSSRRLLTKHIRVSYLAAAGRTAYLRDLEGLKDKNALLNHPWAMYYGGCMPSFHPRVLHFSCLLLSFDVMPISPVSFPKMTQPLIFIAFSQCCRILEMYRDSAADAFAAAAVSVVVIVVSFVLRRVARKAVV